MRSTAIVLVALTLALVLPFAPLAATNAAGTTTSPQAADEAPLVSTDAPLFGALDQAQSCASEEYFIVLVDDPFCSPGVCDQPCEDGGGSAYASFSDRINCNCICCAD